MKTRITITLAVAVLLLLPLSSGFAYQAIFGQSEMLKWDPDRAYNGYSLFTSGGDSVLVDMEGYVVNRWENIDMAHGMYNFLMENGNLRTAGNPSYVPARNTGSVLAAGGSQGRIEEYDWDGNRVWYMDVFDGFVDDGAGSFVNDVTLETYRMHHDYQRIYNATLDEWTYMVRRLRWKH